MAHSARAPLVAGLTVALGLAVIGCPGSVHAQVDYPNKPITFMVGYPPGGLSDLTARAIASAVEKVLKQPVVVLNKPGAAGSLQVALLAQAKPDGYTIGYLPSTAAVVMPHVENVNYDPLKDLTPIVNLFNYAAALVVRADAPWKTVKEFIEYARQNPGQVKYGTFGAYGTTTIVMEAWAKDLGVRWDTVPFKSDADAVVGLLGGHITAAASASMYAPQVRAGKLRILALMSHDRLPEFPDAPRLKDLGHPLVAEGFIGVVGPKGLPDGIVRKLEDAFAEASKDTAYQELLKKLALANQFMRSREFGAFLQESYRVQAELIKKSGVTAK